MRKPDGGPAFPITQVNPEKWGGVHYPGMKGKEGMSLRDWFAGMLLKSGVGLPDQPTAKTAEDVAKQCYAMADAMIKERDNGQE